MLKVLRIGFDIIGVITGLRLLPFWPFVAKNWFDPWYWLTRRFPSPVLVNRVKGWSMPQMQLRLILPMGFLALIIPALLMACVNDSETEVAEIEERTRQNLSGDSDIRQPKEPPNYYLVPESFYVIDRTSDSLTIHWVAAWDPYGKVTFHELHRGQSKNGAYEAVASIDAADSTLVDQGLEPDSVYYYMVRACNDSGCTGFSNEVAVGVTEASGQVAIPAAPVSWRSGAGIYDDYEVMAIWTQVPGATYHEIQGSYSRTPETYPGQEAEVSAPRGSHLFGVAYGVGPDSLGGLSPSTIQTFRIRACNKAGCSPFEPAGPWPFSGEERLDGWTLRTWSEVDSGRRLPLG